MVTSIHTLFDRATADTLR